MNRRAFLRMCVVQGAAVGGFVGLKFPAGVDKPVEATTSSSTSPSASVRGNEKDDAEFGRVFQSWHCGSVKCWCWQCKTAEEYESELTRRARDAMTRYPVWLE